MKNMTQLFSTNLKYLWSYTVRTCSFVDIKRLHDPTNIINSLR
jgi:hypothetical protein